MLSAFYRRSLDAVQRNAGGLVRFAFKKEVDALVAASLERTREEAKQQLKALEIELTSDFSNRMLALRDRLAAYLSSGHPVPNDLVEPTRRDFESDLKDLAGEFPNVFPVWNVLFENARREYDKNPRESLSVEGNPAASKFRRYLGPELRGRVLDVGCGPQSIPLYLEGSRSAAISGVDPLPGNPERGFQFVHGMAEFLPWPSSVFNVVVAATSLDHVISLEKTYSEICRVLTPGGLFITWVGFVPGASIYNPHAAIEPIDQFHLFHFDRGWFLESVSPYFDMVDEFKLDRMNHFYTLSPKMKGEVQRVSKTVPENLGD